MIDRNSVAVTDFLSQPFVAPVITAGGLTGMLFAFGIVELDISIFDVLASLVIPALALWLVALLFQVRNVGSTAGFCARHLGSSMPAALSDRNGQLILCNAAFASDVRPGEMLDSSLGALIGDRDEARKLIYRLANRAFQDGVALERWSRTAAEDILVQVEKAGGASRLVWTVVSETRPRSGAHDGAEYCFVNRAADGEICSANDRFAALSKVDQDAVLIAVDKARGEGRNFTTVDLPDQGGVTISAVPAPYGSSSLLVFPAAQAEAPGSDFFELAPVALVRLTREGVIEAANGAAVELLGPTTVPGAAFPELVEGLGRNILTRITEAAEGKGEGRADLARAARRDRDLYVQVAMKPLGSTGSVLAVLSDATDMEAKERQFIQSQKMQAVGQLAGGVAHDFNNLLTAILGHCDLLSMRRDETDPDFGDLTQIRQNANRAAALVRQLLAFSRQQKLDPRAARLHDLLDDLSHLLDRLIGEKVTVDVSCDDRIWPVWVDPAQFEQVILNLVVNARDAMPEGGRVGVECQNITLREELKRDRAAVPVGDYVRIRISDTGTGMSDEVRAKIFEPFFTTKKQGEGTGLGLSTAYGFVKQTGGFIFVDSTPGEGATFTLLIPRLEDEAREECSPAPCNRKKQLMDLTGAGQVLLVEDEGPVRAFAARALRLRGYKVTEADCAEEALEILEDSTKVVDLVVSDVVMPGMDGPSWVREARDKRPELPVIFTSGYAEDMFRKGLNGLDNCSFLAKPFSLDDLAAAVKKKCPQEQREG